MNKKYNLKLDLQFRCNNSTMKFDQFDNNTSDFFIRITNGGKLFDIEKAIVVLAVIKPSGKVSSQFIEVKNDIIYADLKTSMKDETGTYTAKAMLILEDKRVVTDVISYEVEEDKIFSLLNDSAEASEEFTLLTDMLSRLSTVEISEEQRVINEAERILSEENRKIEEAKRVEAELVRQHEEADRTKYDATRESNENIRKQNESIRLANETNRIDEEVKRVEEENKRKLAEEERNANYNFMTEDEERRRSEANAHKEAEALRVQAETNRVNEEAKRRTLEQVRVSAENTRVSNENTREASEVTRQNNENQRVEAETQRQNRYNSFITDAEANASNFENYTNTAKVKEEERKANELDRKSQEDRRISNEVERISNENTRKVSENARIESEKQRVDAENLRKEKIIEIQSDYDSLKKVIIDENASANLQNQINQTNSQLEHCAKELNGAYIQKSNTDDYNSIVFNRNTDTYLNVNVFRIPAMTYNEKYKKLITTCDVRHDSWADEGGLVSICSKTSDDLGRTFNDANIAIKYPTDSNGEPFSDVSRVMDSTIVCSKSGKTFLLSGSWKTNTFNWALATSTPDPDWRALISVSNDGGETWGTPIDISSIAPSNCVSFLGGVGSGIQMKDGTLVFPIDICLRNDSKNKVCCGIIYSKDDGETWEMSESFTPNGSENNIVELPNSSILMNIRNDGGTRDCYMTKNFGLTWEKYNELSDKITNNGGCQGSFITYYLPNGEQCLLLSTPKNLNGGYERDNITLYATFDYETWDEIGTIYEPSGNGYSNLVQVIDGNEYYLLCVHEMKGDIAFKNISHFIQILIEKFNEKSRLIKGMSILNNKKVDKFLDTYEKENTSIFTTYDLYKNMTTLLQGIEDNMAINITNMKPNFSINGTGITYDASTKRFIKGNDKYSSMKLSGLNYEHEITLDFKFCVSQINMSWSYIFALQTDSINPVLALAFNGTQFNPVAYKQVTSTVEGFSLNTEYHCTVTANDEVAKFYIDGVLIKEIYCQGAAFQIANYNNIVLFNNDSHDKNIEGYIKDFKIFDRCANHVEVLFLYCR